MNLEQRLRRIEEKVASKNKMSEGHPDRLFKIKADYLKEIQKHLEQSRKLGKFFDNLNPDLIGIWIQDQELKRVQDELLEARRYIIQASNILRKYK